MSKKAKIALVAVAALCVAVAVAAGTVLALTRDTIDETMSFSEIGNYLNRESSWYGTDEAVTVANAIVKYQLADGGWRKEWANPEVTGSWAKSTIDNDGTTSEIYILAKVYNETHKKKYKTACLKGIDLLIDAQYDNGGWAQVFDDTGTYHAHITYNDHAMEHVMTLLMQVADMSGDFSFVGKSRAEKAKTAVDKGIKCILDTQIIAGGKKTAWCQQHDEFTLAPAAGRAYEHPSICTAESVGIVQFLMSLPEPSDEVLKSIDAAVKWMQEAQLDGIKYVTQGDDKVVIEDPDAEPLWARFYEIGTNRPIFGDRDGSLHYDVSEISQERRTGYAWYGTWCKKLVANAG